MNQTYKIKNWESFQHYKDRKPPWIKLYRELLDDPDFHELDGEDCKVLILLWLLAAEDKELSGNLPCMKKICFRLRKKDKEILKHINNLSHWIAPCYQDAINTDADVYQDAIPETETETEKKTETDKRLNNYPDDFKEFWLAYPKHRRKQKPVALKEWKKVKPNGLPEPQELLSILDKQKRCPDWIKENGQFIPYPAKWLKTHGWLDEIEAAAPSDNKPSGAPSGVQSWENISLVVLSEKEHTILKPEEKRALKAIGKTIYDLKHSYNLSFDRSAYIKVFDEIKNRKEV